MYPKPCKFCSFSISTGDRRSSSINRITGQRVVFNESYGWVASADSSMDRGMRSRRKENWKRLGKFSRNLQPAGWVKFPQAVVIDVRESGPQNGLRIYFINCPDSAQHVIMVGFCWGSSPTSVYFQIVEFHWLRYWDTDIRQIIIRKSLR